MDRGVSGADGGVCSTEGGDVEVLRLPPFGVRLSFG